MTKYISVADFIEEFTEVYSLKWFLQCQTKFSQLPDNLHHDKNQFIAIIRHSSFEQDILNFKPTEINYTLYDFCYGVKDIYPDDYEDSKFKTIGQLPNGYPEDVLIEGKEYNLMPAPSLIVWKYNFNRYFERDLSSIGPTTEKIKFIEFHIQALYTLISKLDSSSYYGQLITKFIKEELIEPFNWKFEHLKEVAQIISHHEMEIAVNFNLTLSDFCKLFFYLIENGIITYNNNPKHISELLSKGVKIKNESEFKSPNPLTIPKEFSRAAEFIRDSSPMQIDDFLNSLIKS